MAKNNDNLIRKVKAGTTVIQQLRLQSENLSRKDIGDWRSAHQQAVDIENPQRANLYNIYDYTVDIDNMVTGIVMRSKFGIMSRPFSLVDAGGTTV
ncbi:MAG: hypothetical protein NC324_10010, partial [Bacteroides sp.]|nr:hypothetical protein [Bacteroides sp.]